MSLAGKGSRKRLKILSTVTIVGQGYVGLPLAEAASSKGWKVFGFDVSSNTVKNLNAGVSHIDDISDSMLDDMINNGYQATTDPSVISQSDFVVICVPTPLGDAGAPDLGAVRGATQTVGENLRAGTTVVLESTTYPGTTEEVCVPILEATSGLSAESDFYVAFSPERVNPGMKEFGIRNTPKLVGGTRPDATEKAFSFYDSFIETVVKMSGTKEAETAKLLENTFRHVNIALVNEMARVCHELGIDVWEVIRGAATKPFGYMKFTPGAGVGGHCIPIDPNYLSYEVRRQLGYPLRFVELAQEINNSMPLYVVDRVTEALNEDSKSLKGSKVLLVGVTYKPNISDQRESPAVPVGNELIRRGASVSYFDPFVKNWHLKTTTLQSVGDLLEEAKKADCVVLLQNHASIDVQKLGEMSARLLDTQGVSDIPGSKL